MSSPISFQGLATNLPTDSLVSAIIAQESQPMVAMQTEQTTNTTKATALGKLSTDLTALGTAISTLSTTGFSGDTVTSSDSTGQYVTATANGAVPGTYQVSVQALATTARLVLPTAMQPSAAVGTGTYTITDMAGNTVNVAINSTNNSLTGLAAAINAATDQNGNASDVTAAVIQTGTDGTSQLVLSAANTGTGANGAATFQFTTAAGSTLGTASAPAQDAFTGTGASLTLPQAVASPTTVLGAGNYVVTDNSGNTATITLGAGDTLTTLMNDINSGTGSPNPLNLTASIQTGTGGSQLVLTPKSGSGSYGITVAAGSALEVPASNGATSTSTAATNAQFTINGVQLTRTSNSVGDAVQGVTFNLNSAQSSQSNPTNLTVAQDQSASTAALQAVVTAYNQFYKDYQTNNTFTRNSDGSYTTGVFNMDMTVRNLVTEVSSALMGSPGGLPSSDPYTNPADVGLSTNLDGSLSLNVAQFQAALTANTTAVQNLFANSGTSTDPLLSYVSSGANTTTSPIAYSVAANGDGSLTATMTVGSDQPITLQSTDGYFVGAPGTALDGLTFQASAGANGTLSVSTGVASTLQSLITTLTNSDPGDIGGLISNLNETNSNLQILINQQQTYLTNSKASLEQVYSNLESTVGSLQAAGQSISQL